MTRSGRPILVTGAHRTGTTWVGKMLASAPGTAYVSEPMNVLHRAGVYAARVQSWYTYVTRENASDYLPAMRSLLEYRYDIVAELRSLRSPRDGLRMLRDAGVFLLGRLQHRRAVVKDPFAVFSAASLAENLNFHVVITIRHPAAFASSLKRLGWEFDFTDLLTQPLLMRDHLSLYRGDMERAQPGDIIGRAALLWTMIYAHVRGLRAVHPEFLLLRQEDLAMDPLGEFGRLFDALGLELTPGSRGTILRSSSPDNPPEHSRGNTHSVRLDSRANRTAWRGRLTAAEIERVLGVTRDVFRHFYPEPEWS